jgi:pyrroloquinoline quinone biosynthesis protein B
LCGWLFLLLCISCSTPALPSGREKEKQFNSPYLVVLGVAQDAGYPQIGCTKKCCSKTWPNPSLKRFPASLALVDPVNKKWWLFEATPDIKEQLQLFQTLTKSGFNFLPDGIFITHAHIGHYAGLMQLGREAMNANKIPLYAMPRMKTYLTDNGPWSQLVKLNNIQLNNLSADSSILLTDNISIIPFAVPHRDEYSETVGFSIRVNDFKTVFIPDIDKWNKFDRNISEIVKQSDLALLDGTFYKDAELPGRAMSEVPHPFIEESLKEFSQLTPSDKRKIRFIHFNHTNPLLNENSVEFKNVISSGFMVTKQSELIVLK